MSDYAMPGVVEIKVTALADRAGAVAKLVGQALKQHGFSVISISNEFANSRSPKRRNCFVTLTDGGPSEEPVRDLRAVVNEVLSKADQARTK